MDIDELPVETLVEILKRVDGCTLGRCREVSKKWKEVIDGTCLLWQELCEKDFKHSSKIAKRKSGDDCQWYHIYRNLKKWANLSTVEKKLSDFYKFTIHDKSHALAVDYNILPLRDARGFVLYEVSNLKYIPVIVPERDCLKMSNNDVATAILTKSGLFLQKNVSKSTKSCEAIFKADNFILTKDALYFVFNRDVYKCYLLMETLKLELMLHCDYDIKELQVYDSTIYLFTDCGKIVTVTDNKYVSVNALSIPVEWIKQIKHIRAFDDKNFVCYSRNLFKIETDKYQHLYLDFPPITALFFYGEIVIIGTKSGEILLYRLCSQKRGTKPIFENLAELPDGKFAVHIDVVERKTGPLIIIATFFEIMLLEFIFFPVDIEAKKSFTPNKVNMYKRLMKLKDRLQAKK